MIKAIISGIMKLLISLVSIITVPIDALITTVLPDLANALNAISGMFNIIGQALGWVISLTGISPTALSIIVIYYTFALTAPLLLHAIKQAVKWYNALKL